MTIGDLVSSAYAAVAHPGSTEKQPIEHNASHGAALIDHQSPTGIFKTLSSDETTRQIKSQGNNGVGMEGGLHDKAIEQQQRVAERSRLQAEGLFESHMTHDKLTNLTQEHRDVADGSKLDLSNS